MSREVWQKCRIPEKSIVFPRQKWGGIWGESLLKKISVRRNSNLKTPLGHVVLTNALVVPILVGEDVVGQIALADSPAGFTVEMQSHLVSFAEFIGPVLQMYLEKERMHEELRRSVLKLKQTNIALNVMIENSKDSKNELSRKILQSFDTLVFPYFETLSQSHRRTESKLLLEIIQENIQASLQVLDTPSSLNHAHFSPRELQVAQLVKNGKSSKEIAAILRISPRSVFFHRNTLRKKLGIHKAKTNLRTHLLHLDI
jgi:DNA-binding CsgD family transcriptional regulator